jgi:hypothetical protein
VAIPAGGYVLIVPIDPAQYRTLFDIPAHVQIFGPFAGALNNDGEKLTLVRPIASENGSPEIPYTIVDYIDYDDIAPWVTTPDGQGPSLSRKAQGLYGNDPQSWIADATPLVGTPGTGSPGIAPTAAGGFSASGGVHKVVFTFSRDVGASINETDLLLENLTTGVPVATGAMSVAWDPVTFTATWTFPGLAGGKLPEARYRATLLAAGINVTGQTLDGNGDGASGDNRVVNFINLVGDADGNGTVNHLDFNIVFVNMDKSNATWDMGDFDGNGKVDFGDYQFLSRNFGKTLPPNAAPLPPAPAKPTTPAKPVITKPVNKPVVTKPVVTTTVPKVLFAAKKIGKRNELLV